MVCRSKGTYLIIAFCQICAKVCERFYGAAAARFSFVIPENGTKLKCPALSTNVCQKPFYDNPGLLAGRKQYKRSVRCSADIRWTVIDKGFKP